MLQDGERGVVLQRDRKTYAVAPHLPCGVVSPDMLRKIADVAEKYGAAAIKVTSAERIAIIGIQHDDIDKVWAEFPDACPGQMVGRYVRSVKACPGTQFCKRGRQDSLSLGFELDRRYHGKSVPGKMKIGVSGCGNQCAETCIKDIGLIGGAHGWHVVVGGCGGTFARIAQELTDEEVTTERALEIVEALFSYYCQNAKETERFADLIERVGIAPLRKVCHLN